MRILHVVPTYWPAVRYGGPIQSLRALCAAQRALGHEVVVATTSVDGPNDLRDREGAERDVDGVRVHYFPVPLARRLYWSPRMAAWLRANVREFEIVHLHSVFLWPTLAAARIAKRAHVPFVVSPRGMLVPELIRAKSKIVKNAWIRLFERRTLSESAAVIVSSRHEAEQLPLAAGCDTAPVRVVAHGVGAPGATVVTREATLVTYLGRISWEKRIGLLLRAVARVPLARLEVIGDGAPEYLRSLHSLATELGIAGRVSWPGPQAGPNKDAALSRAALLVLPSLSESFGNVVLEAMAAGTPAIVTPGVGARDVVEASGGGEVVEDSEASLASAIDRLLRDVHERVAMGRRAAEYAREHCSWSAIASATISLYESARI